MADSASPVNAVPGFQLAPATAASPQQVLLYTVNTTAPERIESVYMTVGYGTIEPTFQVFAIQLRDLSGVVLLEQPTPVLTATDSSDLTAVLGWSRLGNDSAQEAFALLDDMTTGTARAWANMRLPDLVLQSQSTVWLISYSDFETSSGTITVSDCSVTVTRNAGAVSTTSQVDINALLVPTTTG